MAENRNCCIRELESPQTHPRLGVSEARAGTLWSGRNYIVIGEVHQGIHKWRKSLRLTKPHCKASPAGNPTAHGSRASFPTPTSKNSLWKVKQAPAGSCARLSLSRGLILTSISEVGPPFIPVLMSKAYLPVSRCWL